MELSVVEHAMPLLENAVLGRGIRERTVAVLIAIVRTMSIVLQITVLKNVGTAFAKVEKPALHVPATADALPKNFAVLETV